MVCKCGAMVKASAQQAQITIFGALSGALGRNAPRPRWPMTRLAWLPAVGSRHGRTQLILPAGPSRSGTWSDRGPLVGGGDTGRPCGPAAGALEQHPSLECGRAHHRIALEDLFLHRRKIR